MKNYKIAYLGLLSFVIIIAGSVFNSNDETSWIKVNTLTENTGSLYDLHVFNKDSVWVSGWEHYEQGWRHIVGFTSDGGQNWDTTMFEFVSGYVISFFNSLSGITGDELIYNTYDGGNNWTLYDTVYHFSFSRLICIDQTYAYICGTQGSVIKTTDQGRSWIELESENFENTLYRGLSVLDSLTVYMNSSEQLLRTTDGGITWAEINLPNDLPHYEDVKFLDINNGWLSGAVRSIFRTTNGGETWEDQSPANDGDSFVSIDAYDENTAVTVSSQGAVFWTTNGGTEWIEQVPKDYFGGLFRVQMLDEKTAWAVGRNGLIIKTTTGGVTWIDDEDNEDLPERYLLRQNYPNPFNPSTKIKFSIPKAGKVKLTVYDVLGRKVAELANDFYQRGTYAIDFNANAQGKKLASGVYIYRIEAGTFRKSMKMMLVK